MKREWLILIESLKDFIKEIMLKLSLDFCVLQLVGRLRNGMGKDENGRRYRITRDRGHEITRSYFVVWIEKNDSIEDFGHYLDDHSVFSGE